MTYRMTYGARALYRARDARPGSGFQASRSARSVWRSERLVAKTAVGS